MISSILEGAGYDVPNDLQDMLLAGAAAMEN